jgi:hypothetical protein
MGLGGEKAKEGVGGGTGGRGGGEGVGRGRGEGGEKRKSECVFVWKVSEDHGTKYGSNLCTESGNSYNEG